MVLIGFAFLLCAIYFIFFLFTCIIFKLSSYYSTLIDQNRIYSLKALTGGIGIIIGPAPLGPAPNRVLFLRPR